jgi:hypothetical protein
VAPLPSGSPPPLSSPFPFHCVPILLKCQRKEVTVRWDLAITSSGNIITELQGLGSIYAIYGGQLVGLCND